MGNGFVVAPVFGGQMGFLIPTQTLRPKNRFNFQMGTIVFQTPKMVSTRVLHQKFFLGKCVPLVQGQGV